MLFDKSENGEVLTLTLDKKLTAVTAGELEKDLIEKLAGVKSFTVDMSRLVYVSSAGLRVLLNAQKYMNKTNGSMIVKNAVPEVMKIFETTGFNEILNVKNS
ncbi:MAG: STAS domain-containing protein [Synergistaceae bacterium]|nr:STAS domain-containing protein [Synergistaceae bacterium]